MIKKIMILLATLAMFASVVNAQWTDMGAFPDTSFTGSTHGIAVDPDGKIWWTSYYKSVQWDRGTDTVATNGIRVFNADGTEADFSPVVTVATGGGFVVDTLISSGARGLAADHEGNIIYVQSGTNKMFKINYKTGEGMARKDLTEPGSSPTGPGISSDGTIFVGPVVGGGTTQIAMYDTDLNYIGSAVDGPPAISRCLEVSNDGNTIYWTPFTGNAMYIYNRATEFDSFGLVDSALVGMSIESVRFNPVTGYLWVSSDTRKTAYTSTKWFAFDTVNKTLVDSFAYTPKVAGAADTFPRGLAFTADGMTAYVGTFSNVQYGINKFVFGEAPKVAITFEADMSVQIDKGNFDAATGTMTLAGTMNGWDAAATPMLDGDGDKVYSVTLDLTPGDAHKFKFVMNASGWESIPDREYTVPDNNDTFRAFFDNDDGKELTEIALSFQVNMELEIASARFDPDSVLSARGSFNGWSDATLLSASATDPNVYEGSAQYETFEGDVVYFKYAYTSVNGTNWETNPPTGSGNYELTITADDITNGYAIIPLRGYNNATLDDVVNQESVIRFEVDMNGAVDGNGLAFSSISNVFIAGGNPPLAWPGGGWPDTDESLVKFLFDDGTNGDAVAGDNKWSLNITFPIYSPFDIEYKYGANWGLPTNNGANDNEGGVGSNHHVTLFKSFWSGDAIDVFGTMDRKPVVNGVEQLGSDIPVSYELGQNYPNPFNPSTTINFSIPQSGLVTMKIFNILGQEVAELVNEVRNAGFHSVSFDASDLTSGMYIYKIQSGNFSATRKMMLVK